MARAKKTPPETALAAAMFLFWKEGFHSLGTRQIEEETGITRFTLQATYGGKKALFLLTLDNYLDLFESHLAPEMQKGGLDGLSRWLRQIPLPAEMRQHLANGCLMINSILEFPRDDRDIAARTERYFALLRSNFQQVLETAAATGQLRPEVDCALAAETLFAISIARNVTNKSTANNAAPETLGAATSSLINTWRKD